jgi:cytochrome P450
MREMKQGGVRLVVRDSDRMVCPFPQTKLMSDLIRPALLVSSLACLAWKYSMDPLFSAKVDPRVPRVTSHIPIIGSLRLIAQDMDYFNEILENEFKINNSEVISLAFPGQSPHIFSINVENLEYVLSKNFDNYAKGNIFHDRLYAILGDGIFTADGENWKFQRKLGAKVFTTRAFKEIFETTFLDNIGVLIDLLRKNANQNLKVDMHDILHRFFMVSLIAV